MKGAVSSAPYVSSEGIHVHSPIRALGTFSWPEGRLILLVSLKG
jgi:hypothetical protein